jgi:carboxylate-amine ligase
MSATPYSVGVEEEYQLVDRDTGALRSRASYVLDADWGDELYAEVQETTLEVGTRVCGSAAEVDEEIRRLRLHVGSVVAAAELDFVAAGIHPFSRWQGHRMAEGERYDRILERFGRVLRMEQTFGMHVHVALPAGVDRIPLLNALRRFLPHLLALSASSPIYRGEDTGYASYRTIMQSQLPHSGAAPRLSSEAEYRRLVALLVESGVLEDPAAIYWSLRPHGTYPTLEFRVMDMCPRIEDATAIAALVRALVAAAADGRIRDQTAGLSASAELALLRANEWQAARYGLDASLAAPERDGGRDEARAAIARLLDDVAPVAEALGDGAELRGVYTILDRGNGCERVRARWHDNGGPDEVMRWLVAESQLGVGLDRRGRAR